eukprot:Seg1208.4 transcript_id=Seg1208.4/GoldUCD/mRNA.D3Y31 product="hypothetical protein" protein_id=Seg1208.4/GoldUCD/D3Y31
MSAAVSMVLFLVCAFFIFQSQAWLFASNKERNCPSKPNYSSCRLGHACDPSKPNPCGCPHACCALNTGQKYISVGISTGGGGVKPVGGVGTFPHLRNFICFRKGECNQKCGGIWKKFNNLDKCGCGVGLRCTKRHWYQSRRCKP